jgi:Rieske Fe-S protein
MSAPQSSPNGMADDHHQDTDPNAATPAESTPNAAGGTHGDTLTRRRFLEVGLLSSAGIAGVALAGAGGQFVLGNSLQPKPEQWIEVGAVADIPAGEMVRTTFLTRQKDAWRTIERKGLLYVYTDNGADYTVLDATCTHLGCNVQWHTDSATFLCPCHRAQFDRNGAVTGGPPPRGLGKLETKIENGTLYALI